MSKTYAQSAGETPWRTELAATLRLSWPLALANLLQMLTYAIDVMFIARLGDDPLAASSLSVSIFGILIWTLTGITGVVSALIAAALGRRAFAVREVRRSTRMALWLAVGLGLVATAICWLGPAFMRLTGQEERIVVMAEEYLFLLSFACAPFLIANVLRSFVSALGRPVFATSITALGILVNAAGNYAFVFGNWGAPALGLKGAAIATIMTALFTVTAYVVAIGRDRMMRRYFIFGRLWRPEWKAMTDLIRIGTPVSLTIMAEGGLFSGAAFLMGRIGATELAGHTIALQVAALAFQVPFGVGQAATIRVGYFYGARDRDGMARAGWVAIVAGTGFMALTAAIMLLAPRLVLSIYVDVDAQRNAAMVGFALTYLYIAAAFQLFDGLQAVAVGALRGLQDTRIPMWIAIFSYWIPGFGLCLWLGFATPLGGIGVWIGLAIGLVVAAALLIWRWIQHEKFVLATDPARVS